MIYIILGLLQGLTEFLPVSSSGHLVLAERLFLKEYSGGELYSINLYLHAGTLAAVVFYYRKRICSLQKSFNRALISPRMALNGGLDYKNLQTVLYVLVASVPAALLGVFCSDWVDALFSQGKALGFAFLLTAVLLGVSAKRNGNRQIGLAEAITVGLSQAVAIVPGVSRSGATVATLMLMGVNREDSVEFSFLMSIPVIAGGVILEAATATLPTVGLFNVVIGVVFAVFGGVLGLKTVETGTKAGKNYLFAIYLCAVACVCFVLSAYKIL